MEHIGKYTLLPYSLLCPVNYRDLRKTGPPENYKIWLAFLQSLKEHDDLA